MFTILFLLLLLGLIFPKPIGRFLDGVISLLGKILYPFTIGLLKVIGAILKGIVNFIFGIFRRLFGFR